MSNGDPKQSFIQNRKVSVAITTCCFLLMTGFGSCNVSVEQACRTKLPEFQRRLEAAAHEVAQISGQSSMVEDSNGRAIASFDNSAASKAIGNRARFSEKQKEIWQDWAEVRLKEVQAYLDAIKADPRFGKTSIVLRRELSQLAKEMVEFDSYTEQKRVVPMLKALKNAHKHLDAAAQLACPASHIASPPGTETVVKP